MHKNLKKKEVPEPFGERERERKRIQKEEEERVKARELVVL